MSIGSESPAKTSWMSRDEYPVRRSSSAASTLVMVRAFFPLGSGLASSNLPASSATTILNCLLAVDDHVGSPPVACANHEHRAPYVMSANRAIVAEHARTDGEAGTPSAVASVGVVAVSAHRKCLDQIERQDRLTRRILSPAVATADIEQCSQRQPALIVRAGFGRTAPNSRTARGAGAPPSGRWLGPRAAPQPGRAALKLRGTPPRSAAPPPAPSGGRDAPTSRSRRA